jgi:hypothetical protein
MGPVVGQKTGRLPDRGNLHRSHLPPRQGRAAPCRRPAGARGDTVATTVSRRGGARGTAQDAVPGAWAGRGRPGGSSPVAASQRRGAKGVVGARRRVAIGSQAGLGMDLPAPQRCKNFVNPVHLPCADVVCRASGGIKKYKPVRTPRRAAAPECIGNLGRQAGTRPEAGAARAGQAQCDPRLR